MSGLFTSTDRAPNKFFNLISFEKEGTRQRRVENSSQMCIGHQRVMNPWNNNYMDGWIVKLPDESRFEQRALKALLA